MTKQELRNECQRLLICENLNDCNELLDIYINFFFETIKNHQDENAESQKMHQAKIVNQMMMTKAMNLKKVITGVSYESASGWNLNKIIDPTIIASLVRNIFETVAMFNLVYSKPETDDEKNIMYWLWVSAGLKYRQRFEAVGQTAENKEKIENEKAEIEVLANNIRETELFKNLDLKNQNKIENQLKSKEYQIFFDGLKVKLISWQECVNLMGIKETLLPNIYTYFSLYSHPSNVSVFQFAGMFEKGNEAFPDMATFNLKTSFFMFSIFIADYIKLFPSTLATFENLKIVEQIVINFNNTMARSNEFSINQCADVLE